MIYPSDFILVAVIKTQRDLEIARTLGWYRIPVRTAPKIVSVDAIAFYQPGGFAGEPWRVQYAARVLGVELVKRADLFQDQSKHPRAHEPYFKIQLSTLELLPQPIPAQRWKRITFLYTTGERLQRAVSIADLTVDDDEWNVLWRALRDRARDNTYQVPEPQVTKPEADVPTAIWHELLQMVGRRTGVE
jgi:hypothetical protein